MANRIQKVTAVGLGEALEQILDEYNGAVIAQVEKAGRKAVKNLVKETKATAPEDTGDFKRSIASKEEDVRFGVKNFVWYVKPPHHRLTHLLAHGHPKRGGGRVDGDPFLHNAWDKVRAEYEKDVEEAIKG